MSSPLDRLRKGSTYLLYHVPARGWVARQIDVPGPRLVAFLSSPEVRLEDRRADS